MSADRSAVTAGTESGWGRAALPGPDLAGEPGRVALSGGSVQAAVARRIRARGLAAGWPAADIAAAIGRDCGATRIRAYRLALGIPLADVVAQVHARYEADGRPVPRFSETLLSAYESGQKRPGTDYLHYLCASYGADPADLGYHIPCRCGHGHRRSPARRPAGPDDMTVPLSPSGSVPDASDDSDELRVMLIRQMTEPGCDVDSRFLGAVDRLRGRLDDALLSGTASAAMLDRWEQSAAGYGRLYMAVPPLRLLCDVLLDLAEVRRMCAERQPLEVSERLCRLAAHLAGLAGIAMLDLGDHRLARSFFRTARTAADETGDRQLRAWVTVRESLVPLYYGDPREAAGLAGAAADLAGRQLCPAAVMAPVIRARAEARLVAPGHPGGRGALDRAWASLDRAEDALADLPADHRGDTAFGYTERQFHFHAGDVLVTLGDWQAALRAFSRAGELYASTEVLDGTLVMFGRARCLLAGNEPDEALALGREVLAGLPAEHRTAVVLQVARSLGRDAASRDGRLRALPDYREALRSA